MDEPTVKSVRHLAINHLFKFAAPMHDTFPHLIAVDDKAKQLIFEFVSTTDLKRYIEPINDDCYLNTSL